MMLKVVHSVHPRSRGEISPATRCGSVCSGSPPLARGNLAEAGGGDPEGGFTPARAGKSLTATWLGRPDGVHPRSRGEIWCVSYLLVGFCGSPPLARGNPTSVCGLAGDRRFTPARAGKSFFFWTGAAIPQVHPRSRGEICSKSVAVPAYQGSPPLARGNRGHTGRLR